MLTTDVTGKGVLNILEAIRLYSRRRPDQGPLLPGVELGDVRQGAGRPAEREHAAVAALALRRGQGLRSLHDHQLPRVLRHARVLRHPLQPRVAAPWPGVRDPEDLAGRRPDRRSACRRRSSLGNLDARRDWGFAGDYVDAMWRMLQQPEARRLRRGHRGDALDPRAPRRRPSPTSASTTGRSTSCRTRASSARPRSTCSSATRRKAREVLGWEPTVGFPELVTMMVDNDLVERGRDHAGAFMTRVLVTGATGQDGSYLLDAGWSRRARKCTA